jgi:hypothetical protein
MAQRTRGDDLVRPEPRACCECHAGARIALFRARHRLDIGVGTRSTATGVPFCHGRYKTLTSLFAHSASTWPRRRESSSSPVLV